MINEHTVLKWVIRIAWALIHLGLRYGGGLLLLKFSLLPLAYLLLKVSILSGWQYHPIWLLQTSLETLSYPGWPELVLVLFAGGLLKIRPAFGTDVGGIGYVIAAFLTMWFLADFVQTTLVIAAPAFILLCLWVLPNFWRREIFATLGITCLALAALAIQAGEHPVAIAAGAGVVTYVGAYFIAPRYFADLWLNIFGDPSAGSTANLTGLEAFQGDVTGRFDTDASFIVATEALSRRLGLLILIAVLLIQFLGGK